MFFGFVFSGFNVIVVFCVSAIVAKVLKMLVSSDFLGFGGVAYSCLFGFGRFRCFSGSCVRFLFVQVLFCLFWFYFFFVVGVVLVLVFLFYCFCFFLFFLFFVLFEGLRVR